MGNVDQCLGAARVRDNHYHIAFAAVDAAHAHHDDVVEADHWDVEAEKFVQGIVSHGGGGSETEEGYFLRLGQQVDAAIDHGGVEAVLGHIQTGDGGFEYFRGVGIRTIVFFDVQVYIGSAIGQALSQMQLEVREPLGVQTATEPVDGWLADIGHLGQGRYARMDGGLWCRQDHFCDFTLRFAEAIQIFSDFFQRIHDNISVLLSVATKKNLGATI